MKCRDKNGEIVGIHNPADILRVMSGELTAQQGMSFRTPTQLMYLLDYQPGQYWFWPVGSELPSIVELTDRRFVRIQGSGHCIRLTDLRGTLLGPIPYPR